jgi:hypothetical protein
LSNIFLRSFLNASTDLITKFSTIPVVSVSYNRSRLDGVEIDFDPSSYKEIVDNPSLTGFSDSEKILNEFLQYGFASIYWK